MIIILLSDMQNIANIYNDWYYFWKGIESTGRKVFLKNSFLTRDSITKPVLTWKSISEFNMRKTCYVTAFSVSVKWHQHNKELCEKISNKGVTKVK